MSTSKRFFSRIIAAFFVSVFMLFCLAGCQGDNNQVPALQGKDTAIDVRETIVGFGLASATRSKTDDEVALLLQFSQPLANAQEFDKYIVVKNEKNEVVKGSWVLSDNNKSLRFPYVDASKNYTVIHSTACPSVLVECGFMTDAAEAATLRREDYREKLAGGLSEGVCAFLQAQSMKPKRGIILEAPKPDASATANELAVSD